MLQQEEPKDFVIATGEQYSVREFIEFSCNELGVEIEFSGEGLDEVGIVKKINKEKTPALSEGQTIIRIDPRYFRPAEVETLLGDPTKAKEMLGWAPKKSTKQLCQEMIVSDLDRARKRRSLQMNNSTEIKIFIAGHNGMVGSALIRRLSREKKS